MKGKEKVEIELPKIDITCGDSDRVIIFQDENTTAVPGGKIIVPLSVEKFAFRGRVIAVGHGDEDHPIPSFVKRGAWVAYGKYAGSEYVYAGKTFLIMRCSDIIGPVVDPY